MLEERVAKLLNITMASILVVAAVGFLAWNVAADLPAVLSIYRNLTEQQQAELNRFAYGFALLMISLVMAVRWWRARATSPTPS